MKYNSNLWGTIVARFYFSLFISVGLLVLLLLAITFSGCDDDQSHVKRPVVVNRPALYSIDKIGRIVIEAKCPKGEQMIGGGYRIPPFASIVRPGTIRREEDRSPQEIFDGTNYWTDKATDCDKNQFPLSLEASYPSARDTWTVIINNPDVEENCFHFGDVIQVDCYCVTSKNLPLNMRIYSLDPHPTNLPDAAPLKTDKCNCPTGSVVTAGGFKLEPDGGGVMRDGFSPLWGSYPNFGSDNKAIGWSSDYVTVSPASPAKITTYVLCSTPRQTLVFNHRDPSATPSVGTTLPTPLEDGPVKIGDVEVINGFGDRIGEIVCDEGYFSSGGGFSLKYAGEDTYYDIPHGVPIFDHAYPFVNGNQVPFAGWTFKSLAGHNSVGIVEAGGTKIMDRPTSEKYLVYTVQLNLPMNLEVAIVNPPDGTYITEDPAKKGYSTEIIFKGYGIDHDGTSIPDSNLEWNISGNTAGTGGQLKASIDLNSGTYESYLSATRYTIRLTATSKDGDKETATIFLYYMAPIL